MISIRLRGWAGFILLSIAFTFLLAAQAVRAADRDRITAFLEVTGFDVALDSIALSAGDAPAMLGMSEDDFGTLWQRTADDVFDVAQMQTMALDILEQTLSDELLSHAAEFYASDLGQRLVEVENAAHMLEDTTEKKDVGQALVTDWTQSGNARLGLFERMTQASGSIETSLAMHQELQVRFLLAASAAGVLPFRLDEGALRALMKENEEEVAGLILESSLAGSAFTYRDFSDDELESYVTALEHPQMQQVYELLAAVQFEITVDRFEQLAFRLADLVAGEDL